jgi:DNA replication and repair protein RecF
MIIHSIRTANFRNLKSLNIELGRSLNVFIGENAQGKTNFLEACVCLADGRSFRGAKVSEMLQTGSKESVLESQIIHQDRIMNLKIHMDSGGRTYYLNDKIIYDLKEYLGNVIFVVFSVETMRIADGEPKWRRDFIDHGIYSLNSRYLFLLRDYKRILKNRNICLKKADADHHLNHAWTDQLVRLGSRIIELRKRYLETLVSEVIRIHQILTEDREEIALNYECSFPCDGKSYEVIYRQFEDYLEQNQEIELQRGTTLAGPHRDDYSIHINGNDLKIFGSRGQKRTCVMALKLAEMEMYKREHDVYPVLVLDDVSAELDTQRQKSLMQFIPDDVQILVSLTGIQDAYMKQGTDVFRVAEGNILSMH